MRRLLSAAGASLALLLAVGGGWAHVRLQHPSNHAKLYWSSPESISVVIQAAGSEDLPDGSHRTALRNAIAAWNQLPGSRARLVENSSPAQQARTDWWSNDIHLLIFDEDNSSGYFPLGSSIVAVTPVWFSSSGKIADADVLFNGRSFSFTTSGQPGSFDVQDIGAHELGHLLGLDHSGWAGATMYPYVDSSVILHRSLSADELRGMRDAYPESTFAVLRGRVRRGVDDSNVAGAHVVARDAHGRPTAAGITDGSGFFALRGLDAGTYEIYAHPLQQPVGASNFGAGWTFHVDFRATFFGLHAVAAGQDLDLGALHVGTPIDLSIGRSSDVLPVRGIADGVPRSRSLRGSGLLPGSTLVVSDPSVSVTPTSWFGNRVFFQLQVPAGAPIGHVDLTVIDPEGRLAVLPAAIEVTPPDPIVDLVSPNQGPTAGGTSLTLFGSHFHAGARVVIGGRIYADGNGATVIDSGTLQLTTLPSSPGIFDAVVIDPSGVEGRAQGGFQFVSAPAITAVFPPAGSAEGGTQVSITGSDFMPEVSVRIDGVQQASVLFDGPQRIVVQTQAGVPGGPYVLELENPDGSTAQATYAYVEAPDPALDEVSPDAGPSSGGELVTIRGSAFSEGLEVWFGVDAHTGTGGARATEVELLDEETLRVLVPAHPPGAASVVVRDPASGQAGLLPSAYHYLGSSGGGACHALPLERPFDPREAAPTLAALALLLLALRAIARLPASSAKEC